MQHLELKAIIRSFTELPHTSKLDYTFWNKLATGRMVVGEVFKFLSIRMNFNSPYPKDLSGFAHKYYIILDY